MNQITLQQLNETLKDANTVKVSFNGGMNKETRGGSYITIRKGMATYVYFIGQDLESGADIIENIGPC